MFADYIKMGAKLALIAVVTAAIILIFTTVQIPNLDFSVITQGFSKALAIIYHYVPGSNVVVPASITMLGVQLAIMVFEYGAIAWRWVFKVNE